MVFEEAFGMNFLHRLKDGSGEVLYPRTSFIIDCTGNSSQPIHFVTYPETCSELIGLHFAEFLLCRWCMSGRHCFIPSENTSNVFNRNLYAVINGLFNLISTMTCICWNRSGKMARNRTAARRTVAGRVIKESYGATRQQHTFTVRILLIGYVMRIIKYRRLIMVKCSVHRFVIFISSPVIHLPSTPFPFSN